MTSQDNPLDINIPPPNAPATSDDTGLSEENSFVDQPDLGFQVSYPSRISDEAVILYERLMKEKDSRFTSAKREKNEWKRKAEQLEKMVPEHAALVYANSWQKFTSALSAITALIGGGLISGCEPKTTGFIIGWTFVGTAAILMLGNAVIRPKTKKPN